MPSGNGIVVTTAMAEKPSSPELPSYGTDPLPPTSLRALTRDIERGILARLPDGERRDGLLTRIVHTGVAAFLANASHPVAAADQIAEVAADLGAREAACGRSLEDRFIGALDLVEETVRAHAPRLLGDHPAGKAAVVRAEADLAIFLDRLREHASRGHHDRLLLGRLTPEEALRSLRQHLFNAQAEPDPRRLRQLARQAAMPLAHGVAVVIGVGAALPDALVDRGDVLGGSGSTEAVMAKDVALRINDELPGTALVVRGPLVTIAELHESLALTRRAADLLRARGTAEQGIVEATDLLGDVALQTDDFTAQLLVDKHCGPLLELSLHRRLDLAELLLLWLESGRPVDHLAGDLHAPASTLHHRMEKLRAMYGDKLIDEHSRVELILALRHTLPRWRADAAEVKAAKRSRRRR